MEISLNSNINRIGELVEMKNEITNDENQLDEDSSYLIDLSALSNTYVVRTLTEKDIPAIVELENGNPLYFHYCPPVVSEVRVKEDMTMLPDGKTYKDKYYFGFWSGSELVAVMDLISGYPNKSTAFLGFFMMNQKDQGLGIGTKIIEEVMDYLKEMFSYVRLAYVVGNEQSKHFWLKNKFEPTGIVVSQERYDVAVLQRTL